MIKRMITPKPRAFGGVRIPPTTPPRTRFHTRLQECFLLLRVCALPLIGSFATLDVSGSALSSVRSPARFGCGHVPGLC